jgi:GNAT superfamily N-acetyltransferase
MKYKDLDIILQPLENRFRQQFIKDNQEAFRYGATEEFGLRDDHFEEDGEIISRQTIEECLDDKHSHAFRIICNGEYSGGIILNINDITHEGRLEIFFILPALHSRGIGQATWRKVEEMFPKITVWTTCTPRFEKRNIHFYVNCLGFKIILFHSQRQEDDQMLEFRKYICKNG